MGRRSLFRAPHPPCNPCVPLEAAPPTVVRRSVPDRHTYYDVLETRSLHREGVIYVTYAPWSRREACHPSEGSQEWYMRSPVKAPLATLLSLMLLVAPTALDDPTVIDDESFAEPAAGYTTAAYNLPNSATSVNVASKRHGKGDRLTLYPGEGAGRDTDSVYIYWVGQRENGLVCVTYLNGRLKTERVWVNTAWWRKINVQIDCWR